MFRNTAALTCSGCCTERAQADAEAAKYHFWQYIKGDDLYRQPPNGRWQHDPDGRMRASWRYDYPAAPDNHYGGVFHRYPTKAYQTGKSCSWLYVYEMCDAPGHYGTNGPIGFGCAYFPATWTAAVWDEHRIWTGPTKTQAYEFRSWRQFCATFGKDEQSAMRRGGAVYGVEYGLRPDARGWPRPFYGDIPDNGCPSLPLPP
jgi:hypothetical protein